MDEQAFRQRMDMELDMLSQNQLVALGNRAIQLGLILGHGYRGGKYEILRREDERLLSPLEAKQFLLNLLQAFEA